MNAIRAVAATIFRSGGIKLKLRTKGLIHGVVHHSVNAVGGRGTHGVVRYDGLRAALFELPVKLNPF